MAYLDYLHMCNVFESIDVGLLPIGKRTGT